MTALVLCVLLAAPTPLELKAIGLYKEGEAAYRAGNYDAAIQAFRAADALAPSPEYDFNIAQAYRRKGDCERALQSYREYVRLKPAAVDVKAVRDELAEMEACVKGHVPESAPSHEQPAPPPANVQVPPPEASPQDVPPQDVPPSPETVRLLPNALRLEGEGLKAEAKPIRALPIVGISLGIAGLALGAVGAGLWHSALDDYNTFSRTCMTACSPAATSSSSMNQTIGVALLSVGVAVLIATIVVFVVGS